MGHFNEVKVVDKNDVLIDKDNRFPVDSVSYGVGVPDTYTKATANGDTFLIQKGQVNNLRLRPQVMNEHAESSRKVQGVVNATNIVGQIFKASQDNINGLGLTLESAAGVIFDDFESYANDAALQAVWIASGGLADIEVATVYEGTQAMYLPTGIGSVGNNWFQTFATTDFTGYTGEFQMQSNKEYKDVQMRVVVEDSLGNTSSRQIVQANANVWTKVVVPVSSLIEDVPGSPADLSDIVAIGFEVEKEKKDGFVILDILISVPPPGEVAVKLWDMGTDIPVSTTTALTDGTQYTKLGDLGISGVQASSVSVALLGGKRLYQLNAFVAGVALEIPTNELLVPNHYYAISIHYVDTNVSVYGPNDAWDDYYESGYGFTTPAEGTPITAMGINKDIQFVIFSTQDVYINEISQFVDAKPNGNSLTTIYVEDENMRRTDVLITSVQGLETATKELTRPFSMSKGSKFEQEYADDITDSVSTVNLIMQYYFEPPTVNG